MSRSEQVEESAPDPLVALAEEFAGRYRRGERPDLTEYTERFPEMADRIRRLFPALIAMEGLGSGEWAATGPYAEGSARDVPTTGPLGDYRLLREIGRGGMGVVFEAEQLSLGRRVALKILPRPSGGDPKPLARFLREARAAARLHHTNIVPVFDVGREGDSYFYAMQFIRGQGLDRVIEEVRRLRRLDLGRGPVRSGSATRSGEDAGQAAEGDSLGRVARSLLSGRFESLDPDADAITTVEGSGEEARPGSGPTIILDSAFADRGVSGSDPGSGRLETSAVLPGGTPLSGDDGAGRRTYFLGVARIGRQAAGALGYAHARGVIHRDIKPSNLLLDAAGTVWITDFGLAKSGEDGLTGTGDLLGTLRYMAPERFRGEGDGRADIYALGLSLYELLTLRPAFEASESLQLAAMIRDREPPRPRSLDPSIPRDLETIVLKAIDKDPGRRYQAAEQMAEDLRRFLDREPIRARPISSLGRAALWARRRPAEAGLAAVGLLAALAVMGMATSLWYGSRLRSSLYLQRIATAGLAWRDANMGRLEQLLDSCPEDHRGLWEWRFLKRLCHPELLMLSGHDGGVYRLAYSRDGTRLATACLDGTVRLWDAANGRRLATFRGHSHDVFGLAFSPDGTRLVSTGAEGMIHLWDLRSGRATQVAVPVSTSAPIWDVEFSPDGTRFATAEAGGIVRIWDVKTLRGTPLRNAGWGDGDIFQLTFAPGGRLLAFGGVGGLITVYDLENSKVVRTLGDPGTHQEGVLGLAFRPGEAGVLASGGTNGDVTIWDLDKGSVIRNLKGHIGDVYGVAFSPDGARLASASGDPGVKIWDVAEGRELLTLAGHRSTVFDVAFSPDGSRLASSSQDGTARIWDPSRDPVALVLRGHDGPVNAVAFRPGGGLLASAGEDGTVRLWNTSGRPPIVLRGHGGPVTSLVFGPGGRLLASADRGGGVWLWDLSASPPGGRRLAELGGEVSGLAFHPDGERVVVAPADGAIRSLDVRSGVVRGTFPGHRRSVRCLAIGGGGRFLASGGEDRSVILRDAATGRELLPPLHGHACWVYSVAFAPGGKALSTAGGPPPGATLEGRLASVSGDGELKVWDVSDGRVLLAVKGHGNFVRAVAFHPDGTRIATGGMDRTAKIWDARTGEELLTLRGHGVGVLGVAFSDDGDFLATAGADGTVRIWDGRRPHPAPDAPGRTN